MRVVQSKWLMGPPGQGWSFQVSGATLMQHVIYVSIYKPLTMYVRSMHACSYMYVRSMHACMHACMHAPILGLLSYIGLAFVYAFDCIYNNNLCFMLQRASSTHQPTPVCGSI